MLKIFEIPELLRKRDQLKIEFNKSMQDSVFLDNANDILKNVDEWKFSTGAIFDQPPYDNEMAGFNPGRLLKKNYHTPFEARLKGAYSSGFIGGVHVITVHPSKSENLPLAISRFKWSGDILHTSHVKYFNHEKFHSKNLPSLVGINIFFEFSNNIRANVGVGVGDSCAIVLFYYNERKMIQSASSVTAPFDFQSEYLMHYDINDELELITSGDMAVWKKE